MTNEEEKAIEILDTLSAEYYPNAPEKEALDLAIKALEQESCEDAISREAVNTLVDELARAISDERCFISRGRDTATIMQDILDLPSVTPQQKVGRWIVHPKDIYAHLVCSKCLSNAPYDCKTNYCPNCGADMRERRDHQLADKESENWLSTFNTESATECFTAVQQLKEKIYD